MKLLCLILSMCLFVLASRAEAIDTAKIVVVYGDSITKGEQLKSHGERWVSVVETRAKGVLQIINEGKGGRPTNSLSEFEAMMQRQPKMALLVIALGANDARDISGNCVPNAIENLKAMIGRARTIYGTKLRLLLVGPTNINRDALGATKSIGPQREANLVSLGAAYSELAKTEDCAFVNTYGIVPHSSLTKDGVHPDAAGHAQIAQVMLPAISVATEVSLPPPVGMKIRLWEGQAPGAPKNAAPEVLSANGLTRNVSIPTLTAYLPEKKSPPLTAIIMLSGGAYTQLALQKYANLGTEAFSPRGIAVFNLKYRLSPPSKNVRADALADVERAVRLVRAHSAAWNIHPDRIGLIGASAGANLILNLMSAADAGQPDSLDIIERQSSRPNFVGLLSSWPGGQKISGFVFDEETPIFLLHTEDDKVAPVEFAREIEAAAKKAGVPVQAGYFPTGGHDAFGHLRGPHGDWPQRFLTWLKAQEITD